MGVYKEGKNWKVQVYYKDWQGNRKRKQKRGFRTKGEAKDVYKRQGVYRSMNPRGTAYGYLWVDCDKKDMASVEQSLNTLISNTSHIKMDKMCIRDRVK